MRAGLGSPPGSTLASLQDSRGMHSARRSKCQAIDSIKSDKNNSGNSEVAWQDPSSLAGQCATTPVGSGEECQWLHTMWSPPAPTPAPWCSRAPPDPTVVLFQRYGLVTCKQHGWWGSGGREGCKQGLQKGACRDPSHNQPTPPTPLRGSVHRQDGLSSTRVGWAAGRQSCLLLRAASPGLAQAGASLPAAAACAQERPWGTRIHGTSQCANSNTVREIK